MQKYLALLRGINVGGNKKVEMPRLKKLFQSLDFANIYTYINTGNVIFESNEKDIIKLINKIERALFEEFKFEIKIVIRDSLNIKNLCKSIPIEWQNDIEQKTDILFLWDKFDNKESINLIKINKVDNLKYISGAIVWNIKRENYKESGMNKFIGSIIYKNMTARNVNTVNKLNELMN